MPGTRFKVPTKQMEINFTARHIADGVRRRNNGISRAVDHANVVEPSWSDQAYSFACLWIGESQNPFLCEDIVASSKAYVPEPPTKKAWGGVMARLVAQKVIISLGSATVKSPSRHRGLATLWIKKPL